jgi:SAM-dependent methyltransferase
VADSTTNPTPWSPLGEALLDYEAGRVDAVLRVHHELGEPDDLAAGHFFRDPEHMPAVETEALERAVGRILDLGAGAGSHALELQRRGARVVAADILPEAVSVMEARGVSGPRLLDWRAQPLVAPGEPRWDTILLLMNGPGIAGTLAGFRTLLAHLIGALAEEGQVLLDSTDMDQVGEAVDWEESVPLGADGRYPGELHMQMEYDGRLGEPFPHLFVDPETLDCVAREAGFGRSEVLVRESDGRYLARLSL